MVALAGTYRVEAGELLRMKLVALKHSAAMTLEAFSITHETDIAEPIA